MMVSFYNACMNKEEILESYKKYLIDFHVWKIDASEKRRQQREQNFSSLYSDEELNEIISNSQRFSKAIVNELAMAGEYSNGKLFASMQLPNDAISYVSTGCSGDYKPDVLFFFDRRKMNVSLYLLKEFLGKKFSLSIEDEFFERTNKRKKTCTIIFKPHLKASVKAKDFTFYLTEDNMLDEPSEQLELGF